MSTCWRLFSFKDCRGQNITIFVELDDLGGLAVWFTWYKLQEPSLKNNNCLANLPRQFRSLQGCAAGQHIQALMFQTAEGLPFHMLRMGNLVHPHPIVVTNEAAGHYPRPL